MISDLDYLKFYQASGAFKSRKVMLSIMLQMKPGKPADPHIGQIANFDNYRHYFDGSAWQQIAPVDTSIDHVSAYLPFDTPIRLPKDSFFGITEDTDTYVGNVIVNIVCVLHPFENQLPFMTGRITAKRIESAILPYWGNKGSAKIHPEMYEKFVIAVRMFTSVSGMFITSATRKNTVPPDGIEEFKQELSKKYDLTKSYDQTRYTDELIKFDENFLKGDPSLGLVISGKSKNKARIKLYSAFGVETTFGTGKTTSYISHSLNKGIPTDAKTFSELFTSMRAASHSRGKLTAIGGVLGKLLTRLAAALSIIDGDCGTKEYLTYKIVAGDNSLLGRRMVINDQTTIITKATLTEFNGKYVTLRSPAKCISEDTQYCRYCAGENLYRIKDGLRIAAQQLGGRVLGLYLSLFHGMDRTSSKIPFDDICY